MAIGTPGWSPTRFASTAPILIRCAMPPAMPGRSLRSASPSDHRQTRSTTRSSTSAPTGEIVGRHRKLVPTGAERLVWANGNDHLLTVIDVGGVKVGSLICWENYMPLARMAMYERGVDVLLAPTWDNSDEWVPTLRHIAKEGQIFVVGVTAFLRGSDVPRDLSDADELYGGDDDYLSRGNTTIVAPGGAVIAGPLIGEAGVVSAELDLSRIAAGRRMFDPTGHYSRPDVLSLRQPADGDPEP